MDACYLANFDNTWHPVLVTLGLQNLIRCSQRHQTHDKVDRYSDRAHVDFLRVISTYDGCRIGCNPNQGGSFAINVQNYKFLAQSQAGMAYG